MLRFWSFIIWSCLHLRGFSKTPCKTFLAERINSKLRRLCCNNFCLKRLRRNNFCSWIKLGFILFTNWTKLDFLLIELLLWPKRSAQRKDNWDWDCMKLAQKYKWNNTQACKDNIIEKRVVLNYKWNNATLLIYSLSCLHLRGFPRYPKLLSKPLLQKEWTQNLGPPERQCEQKE